MTTESTATTHGERLSFQAETRQLLDIVIHSLYTDREIFIRELVSNAADALERFRHLRLTHTDVADPDLPLEIHLELDKEAGTFTIVDTGTGMSREELIRNLGTIAHSGTREFLKQLGEAGKKDLNLIGQFGLGFYSAFMVAKSVRVESRSYHRDEPGHVWTSDGSGTYSIERLDGLQRGTRIVVELREEAKDFAEEYTVGDVVKRYSNFVPFPIRIRAEGELGEAINTVQAIWLKPKSEVTEKEYEDFYRFVAGAFDEPMSKLHFSVDAPLAINALVFVPGSSMEKMGMGRQKTGVSLYCNKVLIERHAERLLPDWLRFVCGVLDSPDVPLSVSRESMQDSVLIRKLRKVLTGRLLKLFAETARTDAAAYAKFFAEFGGFLKEGILNDEGRDHRDDIAKLLRFSSSRAGEDELVSFEDYVGRMIEGQDRIYYMHGPSRQAIEEGPYLEAFRQRGIEVLYTFESFDDFVLTSLREFGGKKFASADEAGLELPGEAKPAESAEEISQAEAEALCGWLLGQYGQRVGSVRVSTRLVDSPAAVVNKAGVTSSMRRVYEAVRQRQGKEGAAAPAEDPVQLEINPRHAIVARLERLRHKDIATAGLVADQLLDQSMLAAGLVVDPRGLLQRMQSMMLKLTATE